MCREKIELTFKNWEIVCKIPDFELLLKNLGLQHFVGIITGAEQQLEPWELRCPHPFAVGSPPVLFPAFTFMFLPTLAGAWASGLCFKVMLACDFTLPVMVPSCDSLYAMFCNPEQHPPRLWET